MNVNDAELWSGAGIILLGAVALVAPLFVAIEYTLPLFIAAVLALVAGSLLVGWSRKGRAA